MDDRPTENGAQQPSSGRPPALPGHDGPSGHELAGIGVQFLVLIVVGMYAGQWADRRFGTAPWCLIGGVFLGAVVSFVSMYRSITAGHEPRTKP